jgi:hypothetical protein
MDNEPKNLFSVLSHYDPSAEENYLTESFAYLLRMLVRKIPDQAFRFINSMAGPLPVHSISDKETVSINTQKALGKYGRVDLAIEEADDTLIYIEIKHDSPLGSGQLEAYYQALKSAGKNNHRLVLLKRHKDTSAEVCLNTGEFRVVTWYEVHKWLKEIKNADQVSLFLIQDFQIFLEEKNMSLKKVTWEYIQGVPALIDLRNMLEVAKNEVMPKAPIKRTQGWSWVGLYLDGNFFFGIRYGQPLVVVFENNFGTKTTSKIDLDLEKKHFFSLTADEQVSLLIEFLKQGIAQVKRGKEEIVPLEK